MQWEPLLIKGHIVTRVSTALPTGPEGPMASQSTARPLVGSLGPRGGTGPSVGHMAGSWSRNDMQPEARPKTQRHLGVKVLLSDP